MIITRNIIEFLLLNYRLRLLQKFDDWMSITSKKTAQGRIIIVPQLLWQSELLKWLVLPCTQILVVISSYKILFVL